MAQKEFICPTTKSGARQSQIYCVEKFAAQHQPPLILHITDNDGNCLFDSLQQFGNEINYRPLQLPNNLREMINSKFSSSISNNKKEEKEEMIKKATIMYLREKLVEYAFEHLEDIYEYFELNGTNPEDKIRELLNDGAWFSEMGDIAPQIIPQAFRINIMMYNVYRFEKKVDGKFIPDRIMGSYFEYHPDAPTILLLRIYDGHYQWFSPANSLVHPHSPLHAAAAASSSHLSNENQKLNLQNQLNSLSASMEKMTLSKTRSSGRKPASKSKPNTNANTSMYKKKSITRKKKESTRVKSRTPQYNQYQMLINEMKQMNNNSTNKQNSIVYLSRAILDNAELSLNEKNELMNQI